MVMKTDLITAHSLFGGSVAPRVLRCPGSVSLIGKLPAQLRKASSSFADRGSALHAAMAQLITEQRRLEELAGQSFGDYVVTRDDVEDALRPVHRHVTTLIAGARHLLEHRVQFPGVAETFGTTDLLVRRGDVVHVVDYKFGSGVRVLALYPDGDDDVLNAQLMFYAVAARHSLPEFFAGASRVVLAILQPTSIEPDAPMLSSATVTHRELDQFAAIYRDVCAEARGASPRLARGAWCRFCPARPICPLHTAPLLDLAQLQLPPPASPEYLRALADGLRLLDATADIRTALHDQAKRALESGRAIPGYKLSAGRAARHWRDGAVAALTELGFARDDLIAETLRSPHQVELRAKARGLRVPASLICSSRSGVSLTRDDDAHAPAPRRDDIVRSFTEALTTLRGGAEHDDR
jgi:hypothetical protein